MFKMIYFLGFRALQAVFRVSSRGFRAVSGECSNL